MRVRHPGRLSTLDISRPSTVRYRALVAALEHCAAHHKPGSLAGSRHVIQAFIRFITGDPTLALAVLPGSLVELHNAIHDLEQGAKPALFFDRPRRDIAKPTNLIREHMRGHIAAAMDLLIRHGRSQPGAAAVWLQGECWRAGLRDADGERIAAKKIARWRNNITAKRGGASEAMRWSYKEVTTRNSRIARYLTSPTEAQASARLILQNIAQLVSPESPP